MNKIKKFASLLLALVMALALAAPAFAGENTPKGTITLDNPQEGMTYTAHKIFDVVYDETKTNYSYTITESSAWYEAVKAYATEANGLKLVETTVEGTWTVETTAGTFSAPAFAEYLEEQHVNDPKAVPLVKNGSVVSAEVELGYYFVTTNQGALCNLTTTTPDATIHDKNESVFGKVDDENSVEIGQDVHYTITGKVPATEGYTEYTYEVSDKMSDGLTFKQDSLEVTIGGTKLTEGTDYEVKFNEADDDGNVRDFILNIYMLKTEDGKTSGKYDFGKEIKITYTATVNENAIAAVEENDAKLKYSNDPNDKNSFDYDDDKTYVYSSQIIVEKVDDSTEKKPLPGAKFVLKNEEGKYYYYDEATDKVEWVDNQEDATVVVTELVGEAPDQKAVANFNGLKDGKYYLVETEAPAGYNLVEGEIEIEVKATGNTAEGVTDPDPVITGVSKDGDTETLTGTGLTTEDVSKTVALLQYTSEVVNKSGSLLPSTGGIGTTIFYVVGGVLAAGAVILLITKRRMNIEK